MYDKMCDAITAAITDLPTHKVNKGGSKRKVSEKTKGLYDRRTQLKNPTKQERKDLQKEIKEAGLADFKQWVEECADAAWDATKCQLTTL